MGLWAALILSSGLAMAATPGPPIPTLTGPVVDTAGLLADLDRERLSALAQSARDAQGGQGVQLQYLVIPSLEGAPIEDFAIRVAEAWKLGDRDKDNGLLVLVAVQDRAARIEVGGGLEGEITDLQAGRLIAQVLVPAFQAGRYGDGLYSVGATLLAAAGGSPMPGDAEMAGGGRFGALVPLLFLAIWLILQLWARSQRGPPGVGGGTTTGGFGGGMGGFNLPRGGFGGGGGRSWGGGGGGFSGGGASGRW